MQSVSSVAEMLCSGAIRLEASGELPAARTESLIAANVLCDAANAFPGPNDSHAAVEKETPKVHGPAEWVGEPTPVADGVGIGSIVPGTRTCYEGFVRDGVQIDVGDFVLVPAAEGKIKNFVAKVKELWDGVAADSGDEQRPAPKMATLQWYNHPLELELDAPLEVFKNEVFRAEEHAAVSLDMVKGKCRVVSPKEFWAAKVATASWLAHQSALTGSPVSLKSPLSEYGDDVFVCSKEYLKEDRRIVPLDDVPDEGVPPSARDWCLKDGVMTYLYPSKQEDEKAKGKRGRKPGAKAKDVKPTRTTKRTKATAAVAAIARKEANSDIDGYDYNDDDDDVDGHDVESGWATDDGATTGVADGETVGRVSKVIKSGNYSKGKTLKVGHSAGGEAKPVKRSRGGRIIKEPADFYSIQDLSTGDEIQVRKRQDGVPRGKYGRWAPERFLAAQKNLVDVMRLIGATHPHKAVLRPHLREQARKSVGDTGLLDYLLKHLADTVVSDEGEKLRRRHNTTGHMEYWLQDPKSAHEEDMMVNDEMNALSAELRSVREARNLLQTVREEAAEAVKVVEGVKKEAGTSGSKTPKVTVPSTFQNELSELKAQHEAHIKRSDEEIKGLRATVHNLQSKIDELVGIVEEIKTKGNLDVAMDDVLYG